MSKIAKFTRHSADRGVPRGHGLAFGAPLVHAALRSERPPPALLLPRPVILVLGLLLFLFGDEVAAVERRGEHDERGRRRARGVPEKMRHATMDVRDVAGFHRDLLLVDGHETFTAQHDDRRIVEAMVVRLLLRTDDRDMLTHPGG